MLAAYVELQPSRSTFQPVIPAKAGALDADSRATGLSAKIVAAHRSWDGFGRLQDDTGSRCLGRSASVAVNVAAKVRMDPGLRWDDADFGKRRLISKPCLIPSKIDYRDNVLTPIAPQPRRDAQALPPCRQHFVFEFAQETHRGACKRRDVHGSVRKVQAQLSAVGFVP